MAFTLADLYALPFKPGTFSLVVCRNAFHLLPEPVAALTELLRVTSSGGRIVLQDMVVDDATDKALNDIARLREPAHRRNYTRDEVIGLAGQAGLRARAQGEVRRTTDLDYWLQVAAVPAAKADLIRGRFKELPVAVQGQLDVAFADRVVSFSYDVFTVRLERE